MAFGSLSSKVKQMRQIKDLCHVLNLSVPSSRLCHFHFPSSCALQPFLRLQANNSLSLAHKPDSLRNGQVVCNLHTSKCELAGHSKWSNIKHVKGAQDAARGEKTNTLARKLHFVLSKNSEKNPKLNTELANLIKWARTNNIPNDVIDRSIERAVKLRDPSSMTVFDGRGPSNSGIVLECFSLKPLHTKGLLQGVIKKYGFNLNASATDLFDHKGVIEAEIPESHLPTAQKDPDNFPLDTYVDIAIEAGAEDVTLQSDSEKSYLEFTCAPQDLDKIVVNVEAAGLEIISSEKLFIPNIEVPASKEFLQSLDILKEKLDKHPDVVKYHFNLVPES